MRKLEFEKSLQKFITKLADGKTVEEDTLLFESSIIDSMKILDVLAFIEKKLSISIPDSEVILENFKTIRSIMDRFCRENSGKA